MLTLYGLSMTMGTLVAATANIFLQDWQQGWRLSMGGGACFSLILLVAMVFLPESPRWLLSKGRAHEARMALKRLRYEHEMGGEDLDINKAKGEQQQQAGGSWRGLFGQDDRMRHRSTVGFICIFLEQWTGTIAITILAPTIFNTFETRQQAIIANLAMGIAQVLANYAASFLVDRLGRRLLLTVGGLGMAISAGLFALVSSPLFSQHQASPSYQAALVVLSSLSVFHYGYSWGPLPRTVIAEVSELAIKL